MARKTASELIAELSRLPPDTPLFMAHDEGGYFDVGGVFIEPIKLVIGANRGLTGGDHDTVGNANRRLQRSQIDADFEIVEGFVIYPG